MAYPGTETFTSSLHDIASYRLPTESDVARMLSCGIPDYRNYQPYRLRFLLGEDATVIDILPPGPDINQDSVLIVQMKQVGTEQGFPDGELSTVFDSQLQLDRDGPRLLVARYDGYADTHENLLTEAGLGELVVANLTSKFGIGAPYSSSVDLELVRRSIPALPHRLLAMATPIQ